MKKTKYVGVFVYDSAKKNDKCFYIVDKKGRKTKFEKFGGQSEGCTAIKAYEYRMEKLKSVNKKIAVSKENALSEVVELYKVKIKGILAQRDVLRYLAEIEDFFGSDSKLEDIAPLNVVSFIDNIKKCKNRYGKSVSAQTVLHRYAVLRQLYNYASGLGLFKGVSPLTPQTKEHIPAVSNTVINYFTKEKLRDGSVGEYYGKNNQLKNYQIHRKTFTRIGIQCESTARCSFVLSLLSCATFLDCRQTSLMHGDELYNGSINY